MRRQFVYNCTSKNSTNIWLRSKSFLGITVVPEKVVWWKNRSKTILLDYPFKTLRISCVMLLFMMKFGTVTRISWRANVIKAKLWDSIIVYTSRQWLEIKTFFWRWKEIVPTRAETCLGNTVKWIVHKLHAPFELTVPEFFCNHISKFLFYQLMECLAIPIVPMTNHCIILCFHFFSYLLLIRVQILYI